MSHEAMAAVFLGPMQVEELSDTAHRLLTDMLVLVEEDPLAHIVVSVPSGFVTDYASVPRFAPLAYALFGNIGNKSATVHDFLYSSPVVYPREWCDAVFRSALIAQGIERWKADAMYAAVCEFGGPHYNPAPGVPVDRLGAPLSDSPQTT